MKLKTFTKQSLGIALIFELATGNLVAQSDMKRLPENMESFSVRNSKARTLVPRTEKMNAPQIVSIKSQNAKAAGDTIFYQGFDASTTWPADMLRLNVDGKAPGNNPGSTINTQLFGNNAWVTTTEPPEANRFAASLSWTTQGGVVNRWMITPPLTITQANLLQWKARAFNPDFPDGYEVRVCTTCPSTITNNNVLTSFSTTLFSIEAEVSDGSFVNREVSLSSYEGQTIRIAFRNNSNDQDRLYMDDLLVIKQPSIDVAASAIISPSNFIYDCSRLNFPAKVAVQNKGANTAYNVEVKLRSNGPLNDTVFLVIDSLVAGKKDTIQFTDGLNLSTIGDYTLTLETETVGDDILANNSISGSYIHRAPATAPFFTNFDELNADSTLPQDWYSTSRFLAYNPAGGFDGTQSLELPVFNNLGTLGSQPTCQLITSKYSGMSAGNFLTFKYKLVDLTGAEYGLQDGDSVFVRFFKNCQLQESSYKISSANHESSTFFKKVFIPLDPFSFSSADEVSIEFFVKSNPTTNNFLFELDDLNIGTVANNDVVMADLQGLPFSIIKKTQLGNVKFKGSVFNEGLTELSPVRIVATVNPLAIEDTARISSLASGSQRPFTTGPGFTVTASGSYTIDIQASVPGLTDPNPNNNLKSTTLEVSDSTIAKDFGESINEVGIGYGPGSGLRIMANAITTLVKDTLTSVSIFTGTIATNVTGKAFFANKVGTNWVLDSSSTAVTITPDESNTWVPLRYRLRTGPVNIRERGKAIVANSTNLYGVKISSGDLRLGFNLENAEDDGSFIYFNGSLTGTQGITIFGITGPYTLFVRPNFGRPTIITSISQLEQSLQYSELVPNPAHSGTNLVFNTAKSGQLTISLHTITGQLVSTSNHFAITGTNRLEVPVKGLSKGIYLVRVASEGYSATKKLIID